MFGFVPIDVCCRKITFFYYCDFMIFCVSGQSQYIMQGVAVLVCCKVNAVVTFTMEIMFQKQE